MVARVHKDSQEEFVQIAKKSMTLDVYEFLSRVYKWDMKVPLGFGSKIAPHWGDSKEELKLDVFPTGEEIDRS